MYLLTFVTLLISLIGIYTQVIAVQTARLAGQQSSVAAAMLTWHTAAVSMAESILRVNAYAPAPACNLTTGATLCPAPTGSGDPNGTVTNGTVPNFIMDATLHKVCVNLPMATCTYASGSCTTACTAGFDTTNYQFYSVLFRDSGQNYIVTYLKPAVVSATNPSGFLKSANGTTTFSVTSSDLLRQFRNVTRATYAFGSFAVSGGSLVLNTSGGISYPMPALIGNGEAGGVAVIGTP